LTQSRIDGIHSALWWRGFSYIMYIVLGFFLDGVTFASSILSLMISISLSSQVDMPHNRIPDCLHAQYPRLVNMSESLKEALSTFCKPFQRHAKSEFPRTREPRRKRQTMFHGSITAGQRSDY